MSEATEATPAAETTETPMAALDTGAAERRAIAMSIGGDAQTKTEAKAKAKDAEPVNEGEAAAEPELTVEGLRELAGKDLRKAMAALGIEAPDWKAYHKRAAETTQRARTLDSREAEFRQQSETWTKTNAGELESLRQTMALAKKDPIEFLEKVGLKVDDLALAHVKAGKPEAALDAQAKELAEIKAELAAAKKATEERAAQAELEKRQGEFVSVALAADKPALRQFEKTYGRATLFTEADDLATKIASKTGTKPLYAELAAALEKGARVFLKEKGIPFESGTGAPQAPDAAKGAQATPAAKIAAKPGAKAKTLGSDLASEKGSGAKPQLDAKQRRALAMQLGS